MAARARRSATASAPRTEPNPSTLPLTFAPGLLSAAHRLPAHHAPAVESLRSSGAASAPLPSQLARCGPRGAAARGRAAVAVAFPAPTDLAHAPPRPVPPRFRCTSTRGRASTTRHAATLPARRRTPPQLRRPADPPHGSRAAPSLHSPPTPTASRSAPLERPSIASPGRSRGCSGGTFVSSCAARLALREPRGAAAAVPAGRDSRRARPPAAVGADHPHPLPRRS